MINPAPLTGRIALITGASRGIGQATAVHLGRAGVHCLLLARTIGGLEETDSLIQAAGGPPATLLPYDLTDRQFLRDLGPTIGSRFPQLDILVHAAGIAAPITPISHLADKDWDRQIATGLTAGMGLLRATTPLLTNSPSAVAVFLKNSMAAMPPALHGAAAVAQSGFIALLASWKAEMAHYPHLHIHSFDPGPCATRLRAASFPAENREELRSPDQVGAEIATLCLTPSLLQERENAGKNETASG